MAAHEATAVAAVEEIKAPNICQVGGHGMFFPLTEAEQFWPNALRVVLYLAALLYLFLGVNVVSDKFVGAIEMVCSQKKRIRSRTTGRIVTVAIWNRTVANLTLMALGSSSPEILLSIIETVSGGFYSGDLGPGTIVGSAAFNLFMIVAVCMIAIPSPESRRIKDMGVYYVTAAFSLFAYFWLVLICTLVSPDIVELWEAIVTLLLGPLLIFVSYLADIGYFTGGRKPYGTQLQQAIAVEDDPMAEPHRGISGPTLDLGMLGAQAQSAGVLSFPSDTWNLAVGLEEREVYIPVLRRHGFEGEVSCKYRLEGRSAVPGYDFVASEGELHFAENQDRAFVQVTVLPKRLGEHSDNFQIIIEDPEGGAIFDPRTDGGEERCVLTVTILNENDDLARLSAAMRASRWVDGAVNVDSLQLFVTSWYQDIVNSVVQVTDDDGPPSAFDWAMHICSVPWKLPIAIVVPPAHWGGGWPCFIASLGVIAILTCFVIDFSELFGCVAHIEESIIAITLVALGTSMPDLFASKVAAQQDEWADASIVNVTGSNSVNVFLGIGLPWTMAAIYWATTGATDDWLRKYSALGFAEQYPDGAFVVVSGDLTFGVIVFTIGASIAFALIKFRRDKLGGELGGPFTAKVLSAGLMTLLWCFYIVESVWKIENPNASFGTQAGAILIGVCVLENVMLVLAVAVYCMKGRQGQSKEDLTDLEARSEVTFNTEVVDHRIQPKSRGPSVLEGAPPSARPPTCTLAPGSRFQPSTPTYGGRPHLRESAEAFKYGRPPAGTIYGARFQDVPLEPVGAMSFCSAAMVCIAVKRFRSLDRRFRSCRDANHLLAPSPRRVITRESSFHTVSNDGSSVSSSPRDGPHPARAMAGRVVDLVGRNAVDWAALSAAGLAAAQLVDPEGTAALLSGGRVA